MLSALIPGSFDPITCGHLDVITRAAALFDRVTVAVMTNDMHLYVEGAPVKHYLLDQKTRRDLVAAACAHLSNVTVVDASGLLIDLHARLGTNVIIKGVRTTADFEYEQAHAIWNRAHNPLAETLYFPADPAYDGLSSTLVREKLSAGESVEGLVPDAILPLLMNALSHQSQET